MSLTHKQDVLGDSGGLSFVGRASITTDSVIAGEYDSGQSVAATITNQGAVNNAVVNCPGHSFAEGGIVDVIWNNGIGKRIGMVGNEAADNTIRLIGGSGDDLPGNSSVVQLLDDVRYDVNVVGSAARSLLVQAVGGSALVAFVASNAHIASVLLAENRAYQWNGEDRVCVGNAVQNNPIAAATIDAVAVLPVEQSTTATAKVAIGYNAVE